MARDGTTDGIAAFWAWWPTAGGRIQAAIEGGGFEKDLVAEIMRHVKAIDEELDWELGPGGEARHAFCLSSKGDPLLRKVTERWLRAAPPRDDIWEYHPARRGGRHADGARLKIAGFDLMLDEFALSFEIDELRELVNVTCFHPAYRDMADDMCTTAAFLMLDDALGEDGVERWIGGLGLETAPPAGAKSIADLRAAIAGLAASSTGERYALLEGEDAEGRPFLVMANMALKRINHLDCDHHVAVDLAVLNPTPQGMPTGAESDDLNALEDEITPLLAGAAYLGRSSGAGRRAVHFFAPGGSPARALLADWASAHRERHARVTWTEDPRWEARERII